MTPKIENHGKVFSNHSFSTKEITYDMLQMLDVCPGIQKRGLMNRRQG